MSAQSIMSAAKRRLMGYSIFPVVNAPFRAFDTWRRYVGPTVKNWIIWIFTSREDSNFTYALSDRCKTNLAASISSILQKDYEEISSYFREIEGDADFNSYVRRLWGSHPERNRTDEAPNVGRRIVWYAIARATKPRIVVETGVDHCFMCCPLPQRVRGTPGPILRYRYQPERWLLFAAPLLRVRPNLVRRLAGIPGYIERNHRSLHKRQRSQRKLRACRIRNDQGEDVSESRHIGR